MVAISTIVAPIIAGTLTIREYFTAYERVMPPITHAEIVEPRRERPGIVEKALEESGNQCIFRLQIFLAFFSLRKHICHHKQNRRQIQTNARCQQIRGGQCDKALNHAADYSSRDGGQNQQESKHTVVAAEYLPVLLSLLMLTGKVFL